MQLPFARWNGIIHPLRKIKGEFTLFMRVYVDDTEDKNRRIILTSAAIIDSADAEILELEWFEALPKCLLRGFHATDCASGWREFEHWHLPARQKLFDDLTAILTRHPLRLMYHGMDVAVYRQLAPTRSIGRKAHWFGKNEYIASLFQLLDGVHDFLYAHEKRQCALVLDCGERAASAYEALQEVLRMRTHNKPWWETFDIPSVLLSNRAAQPLLQIPDLFAYLELQKHAPDPKRPCPITTEALLASLEPLFFSNEFWTGDFLRRMYASLSSER